MPRTGNKRRSSVIELLIHLLLTPSTRGTFSWSLAPDQMNRLADDLRWTILRKIYPGLGGKSPYRAHIQKHAIKVESLDRPFFRDVLEVVRDHHARSFSIHDAREMNELALLETYFIPVILEWAENERSTSVARERTPSIEELITHEDSSGNVYQRFPEEFAWAINRLSPGVDPESAREIPADMQDYARRIAYELTGALMRLLNKKKFEKYIILVSRLEDNTCTWEMTFNYLNELGLNRYSSWKSLSVVANRAMNDFVRDLPPDVRTALHQEDPELSREEKHERLRTAVAAAMELNPVPSPREVLATASA